MTRGVIPCAAMAICVCITGSTKATADQVMLTPTQDTTIYEDSNSLSNGAGDHFFAGNNAANNSRRALLQFDIAGSIPAMATIDAVRLDLNMSRTITGSRTIELHKVLASWGEGESDAPGNEGGGAAAQAGDATWSYRSFNETMWSTPGGDFAPTASAATSVGGFGTYSWSSNGMVDDVQQWLDTPGADFGWLLKDLTESSAGSAKRFDSADNPNPSVRPRLTVDFTPIPEPGAAGLLLLGIAGLVRRR